MKHTGSSCYRYGLQLYHQNARGMEQIRQKLLREKRRAGRMIRDFERKQPMELRGIMLKRAYAPEEKPVLQKWLNMRTISFSREASVGPEFMDRKLLENMLGAYDDMQEIYFFLKEALAEPLS